MGPRVAVLLLALLVLSTGVWLFFSLIDPAAPPAPVGTAGSAAAGASATVTGPEPQKAAARTAIESMTPRRPRAGNLADAPTAWLQVVDHDTFRPVVGASVRRFLDGSDFDVTDERGISGIPLQQQEQLAVIADGYLLRMAPTQVGTTEREPQRVSLIPDTFSHRCRFRFVRPDGQRAAAVRVQFRCLDEATRGDAALQARLRDATPEVRRAFEEHCMIAILPVFADLAVQLREADSELVHSLPGEGEVRFGSGGLWSLAAIGDDGFVGQATFQPTSLAGEPLLVPLQPGRTIAGIVRSASTRQALAGARITPRGGDALRRGGVSDAAGRFVVGPFADGVVALDVRHGDHEPMQSAPIAVGEQDANLLLTPLPRTLLRGRVRMRPDLVPIAGAAVSVLDPTGRPNTVRTDAEGTFAVQRSETEVARLRIVAQGCLFYTELVDPDAPFRDYDLWPDRTEVRLDKGLTGVLRGIVVDRVGAPVAGVPVRFLADLAEQPNATSGRRVVDGGALFLPLVTTSTADGSFVLETHVGGPGRLVVADDSPAGASGATMGTAVTVVLGRAQDGFRLVTKEKERP